MARSEPIDETIWPEVAYFAQQFKKAREDKKMNQRQFADLLEISQTYVAHVEQRKVNPQLTTMVALAKALDKPLSYFIFDRIRPIE